MFIMQRWLFWRGYREWFWCICLELSLLPQSRGHKLTEWLGSGIRQQKSVVGLTTRPLRAGSCYSATARCCQGHFWAPCCQITDISKSVETARKSGDLEVTGTIGGHVSVMWWLNSKGGIRNPECRLCTWEVYLWKEENRMFARSGGFSLRWL